MKYLQTNILLQRMKRLNRFGQSVCGLQTIVLRRQIITADNRVDGPTKFLR
jgi:hypothetical protein